MKLASLPGVCRQCSGAIHLYKSHICENPFKKFQIRTKSHLESKTPEEWLKHYHDAVFDGMYVFFTVVDKDAMKAIESIRDKVGVRLADVSIWAADKKPPWKKPKVD